MPHYFSEDQEGPLRLKEISSILRGHEFKFYTASGVFSRSKVDKGSEIFIKYCLIEPNWHILDLGCGYGPVGIALAKVFPDIQVSMTDINRRAVMLVKKNIILNGLNRKRFKIMQGDAFSKLKDKNILFDSILLNPPQTAGRKICVQMIQESINYLKSGGWFQIVARHNKGGSTLEKEMINIYGNSKQLCKKKGFRVYVSQKVD